MLDFRLKHLRKAFGTFFVDISQKLKITKIERNFDRLETLMSFVKIDREREYSKK